eukprot:COSAG02_NODE_8151_length_2689_cov_1.957143_2_plen_129_part_00
MLCLAEIVLSAPAKNGWLVVESESLPPSGLVGEPLPDVTSICVVRGHTAVCPRTVEAILSKVVQSLETTVLAHVFKHSLKLESSHLGTDCLRSGIRLLRPISHLCLGPTRQLGLRLGLTTSSSTCSYR